MTRDPRVSLIISCYNQQAWMTIALRSALAQQADIPYEIVVCDDGSSDGGFEAIRALASSSTVPVTYIWQQDRGFRLARSRNHAIRCARGDVCIFVDGDSWLSPALVSDHWGAHAAGPVLACGLRRTVMVTMAELATWSAADTFDPAAAGAEPADSQPEHTRAHFWVQSKMPWMACLGGNFSAPRTPELYFDEEFESWGSEDRDLAFRLWRAGLKPKVIGAPNVVQLRLPGQDLADMDPDAVASFIRNKQILRRKYPQGELDAALGLIRRCHLDPATQRWSIGAWRDLSANDIFREFEAWEARAARS